jgi:energy-coupling factor transporter ATP-binding protein EcfA2
VVNLATKTALEAPTPAAAQAGPVVELNGLEVKLGGRPILQGLNATLTGRCIGLLGFYPTSGGSARVLGLDVRTETRAIRSLMGYMPENDAFIQGMSGVRFVRLMAELSGLPKAQAIERAHEVLFYVGLGEARYRPVEGYSLGMKQLAKLAQALVHGPRLVFLDEPTNGLDPVARQRMIRLVRDITEAGGVRVILSSHLLRDVEECCSRRARWRSPATWRRSAGPTATSWSWSCARRTALRPTPASSRRWRRSGPRSLRGPASASSSCSPKASRCGTSTAWRPSATSRSAVSTTSGIPSKTSS